MVAQLGEDYTSATISSRQSRSVLFSGYRTGKAKRRACNPSSLDDYVGTAEIARACFKNVFLAFLNFEFLEVVNMTTSILTLFIVSLGAPAIRGEPAVKGAA